MIKASFNSYNNYITDSLYQWDKNQDLTISGLNLKVAPEVHFSNANMDRAIARQSTLSSGVVTVQIPNSILQEALTIKAHVGVYEGDTFKTIEIIEIPVIAKKRPSDYTLTDSDDEIYSFNELENKISNAVTTFDNKVVANNQALNARIDNIVVNANNTEGNSELVDIRVDVDGVTHNSAGEAVRGQVRDLKNDLFQLAGVTKSKTKRIVDAHISASGIISSNVLTSANDVICFEVIPNTIIQSLSATDEVLCFAFFTDEPSLESVSYNSSRTVINATDNTTNVIVPNGCNWIAVRVTAKQNATIIRDSAIDGVMSEVEKINKSLVNQDSNTFGIIDMNSTTTDLGKNTNAVTVWRFAKIGAPSGEYQLEKIFLKSAKMGTAHICIATKTKNSFTIIDEFDMNVVNNNVEYINGLHFHSDTIIKEGYLIGCKIPPQENVYMYYGGTEGSYTANDQTYTLSEMSYGISIGAKLKSSIVERISNIEKKTINSDNPLIDIYKVPTFITSFGRICCIGDSLTHGDMNTTNNGNIAMPNYSYPTIMARLTGCTVLNYGLSGYRAKKGDNSSWLRQAELNNWLTNEDKCNLYIIALGTNDMAVGFSGDINTDINLDDYTQNADTSVGGYASIIQKIRSIQPRAKIFCVTIPISRDKQIPAPYGPSDRLVANTKIRNIASMFDCYVIDLEKYGEYTTEDVSYFENVYKNATHNNALGYNLRARQYISYIDWIIANNLEEFQDIQFIGTNYTFED